MSILPWDRLLSDLGEQLVALLLERSNEYLFFASKPFVYGAKRDLRSGRHVPQSYRLISITLRERDGGFHDAFGPIIHD